MKRKLLINTSKSECSLICLGKRVFYFDIFSEKIRKSIMGIYKLVCESCEQAIVDKYF